MNQEPPSDAGRVLHPDQISLLGVSTAVIEGRRLIVAATFVSMLFAVISAATTGRDFTATASFLPAQGEQGTLSGARGLAQQFGFSVPSSSNAGRSPRFYADLVVSREILDGVIESGVDVHTPDGTTLVDLAERFNTSGETAAERTAWTRRALSRKVSVSEVPQTSVIAVSVRTDEPELSAAILRRIIELISAFDMETRRSQAAAERSFAEERLGQLRTELTMVEDSLKLFLDENRQVFNSPQLTFENERLQRQVLMRQELVTAMAQAFEQARIDEVRNTPVLTIIDQPLAPAIANPRGRLMKLITGLAVGLLGGLALVYLRELSARSGAVANQSFGEFKGVLIKAVRDPFGIRASSRPSSTSRGPIP